MRNGCLTGSKHWLKDLYPKQNYNEKKPHHQQQQQLGANVSSLQHEWVPSLWLVGFCCTCAQRSYFCRTFVQFAHKAKSSFAVHSNGVEMLHLLAIFWLPLREWKAGADSQWTGAICVIFWPVRKIFSLLMLLCFFVCAASMTGPFVWFGLAPSFEVKMNTHTQQKHYEFKRVLTVCVFFSVSVWFRVYFVGGFFFSTMPIVL